MKLKLNSFLFALAVGLSLTSYAQNDHFNCGHDNYMRKLWAEDPQLKADFLKLLQNSKVEKGFTSKAGEEDQRTVYVIPIVFHILHQYGGENVTDAQIKDQVEVLNRDFMLLNTDITNAVAGFDTIADTAYIQFRLATIDPWGNCTNGIDHIYTHEHTQGDDYSKLNQWHRSNYLNVWLSTKIGSEGAAGYAYYPTGVEGSGYFRDGIIINHTYIGRIGTGDEFRSRALTHEIGHYLGLAHTWGDNNDPGVACGDDGVEDTPITKGFKFCPSNLNQAIICNTDDQIVENYQNYMDYSYCSIMFTKGQVERMRGFLNQETSSRNNLWKDSNLVLTGTSTLTTPLCKPIADFNRNYRYICMGGNLTFKDESWNANVESRLWRFEGGTPETSTSATQNVTFDTPGYKKITLVVSNAAGSDSLTLENTIYVAPQWGDYTGPHTETFDGAYPYNFIFENPENNYAKWHVASEGGIGNSKCLKLNNYKNTQGAPAFSEDYFYYNRLGGNRDAVVTPGYDLRYTTDVEFSFDYAYATNGSVEKEIVEELNVYSSSSCGTTWNLRKKINKADLLTGGNSIGVDFKPTASQWKTVTIPLSGLGLNKSNARFKIELVASDVSNNMYIDNIRVTGVLSTDNNPITAMEINVYPNPASSGEGINIDYVANNEPVQFQLLDIQGKVLATETNNTTNSSVTHKMTFNNSLASGYYYLKVNQGNFSTTKKVVIL